MDENELLIRLTEDLNILVKHHMKNDDGITTSDLTNCICHILETCHPDELASIINELKILNLM